MRSPFEGRLVRLRAREPGDEPLLYQWFNDPEVTEYLSLRYPVSHAQERDFIANHGGASYTAADFGVETLTDRRLIGGVSLFNTSPEKRSAELGIAIGDKSCWDGGYGTDTMLVICRFGFETMNLHRIQLNVITGNERARHVYEKVGFREEGRLRDASYRFGHYRDVVVMGLLEGELREG
jgi:RimJ/RimL family protein N-acetyltransferase